MDNNNDSIQSIKDAEKEAEKTVNEAREKAKQKIASTGKEKEAELEASLESVNNKNEQYLGELQTELDKKIKACEKKVAGSIDEFKRNSKGRLKKASGFIVDKIVASS